MLINSTKTWVLWIFLPLGLGILLYYLQPNGPLIGHDYYHMFPRYLAGLHFMKNNPLWSIPHYTPYLCGGIPLLADPQSLYYSMTQFLILWFEPFKACLITAAVASFLGYFFSYRFLVHTGTKKITAHLGGLLFILNGFTYGHLWVGHVTHLYFFLLPVFFFILFFVKNNLRKALYFSLLWSLLFYAGGFHCLVILFMSCIAISPYFIKISGLRGSLKFGLYSLAFILLFSSGKLVASFLYSKNFFVYPVSKTEISPLFTVIRYFYFNPFHTHPYENFSVLKLGAWEYIGFVSKITFPILLFGFYLCFKKDKKTMFISLALSLAIIFITLGKINLHYHNPIKLLSAFIPFIIFLSVLGLDSFFHKISDKSNLVFFFLMGTVIIFEFIFYAQNFYRKTKLGQQYPYETKIHSLILEKPQSVQAVLKQGRDDHSILKGESYLSCYEPIFGYRKENFFTQLTSGGVYKTENSFYNFNHPGCFLYGKDFNCKAWDRISVQNTTPFENFLSDHNGFSVPKWQSFLYGLNFISILLGTLFLITKDFFHNLILKKSR